MEKPTQRQPKKGLIRNGHRLTDVLTIFGCKAHPKFRVALVDEALVNYILSGSDLRCPFCRSGWKLVVESRELGRKGENSPAPWSLPSQDNLNEYTEAVA